MPRALLLLLFLPLACGGPPQSDGAVVEGYQGVFSLLRPVQENQVRRAPKKYPPKLHHMRTGEGDAADHESLPCIQVRPPTTFSLEIPPPPQGAVLELAIGIRRNGYRGRGKVTFRGTLAGAPLFEESLDCSEDLPPEEQRWHRLQFPLQAGGELVLSADYGGTLKNAPIVGFGQLRVSMPFRARRQRASKERPNIMLVVIDTLRADRLSCYGYPKKTSPNLDQLAEEGLLFERAICSSSWTIPGTASILTGLTAPEHGLGIADSNYLSDRLETLPRLFARAGFVTAGFTANPLIDGSRNFDQGFETFHNWPWAQAPRMAAPVEKWIASVGDDRFFLYLHLTDPHAPYIASPEALARQGVTPQEEFAKEQPTAVVVSWYKEGKGDLARAKRAAAYGSEVYNAEIDLCDHTLGLIFDRLKAAGHGEDTVICVTADHGEEFLDHQLVGHFNQLYPETNHVPLILWGPGIPRGKRVATPVGNRRLAPTLLELGGISVPRSMGRETLLYDADLQRIAAEGVFGAADKGHRATFETHEWFDLGPMYTMIDGPWQLITCTESDPPGHGYTELYDLREDPHCHSDLAAENPERVKAMRAAIDAWLERSAKVRPSLLPTTEETRNLLRSIGYLGEDE